VRKFLGLIYGAAAYVLFLVVILYAIGFVANWMVPKSIDSGAPGALLPSLAVNAALLTLFALQHSIMARPGFKTWWARIVSPAMERSTYVVLSSLALILLFWQWQPLAGIVWRVDNAVGAVALHAIYIMGWAIVFGSSFGISHFDLFGLRQVYFNFRNQRYPHLQFRILGLYRLVRHPLMLGFVIAFWAAPTMSVGHLFFAAATTLYILVALQLEERDLVSHFGDEYRGYQRQVPMLLPLPRK
jgi:methanethiol S-methyltransferase